MKVNKHLSPWMRAFCEQLLDGPKPYDDTLLIAMGHVPPGVALRTIAVQREWHVRRYGGDATRIQTSIERRIHSGSRELLTDCVRQGIKRGRLRTYINGHDTKMVELTDLGKRKYFVSE